MTLTCVHGFLGAPEDWQPLLAHLPELDVDAPALVGHNPAIPLPPPDDFAFDRQVAQIQATDVLLGYSMGARLALAAALDKPGSLRGLILIGGTAGLESETDRAARRQDDAGLAAFARAQGTAAFLEMWKMRPVVATLQRADPAVLNSIMARRRRLDPEAIARTLEYAGTGCMPNLWPRLGEFDCPVLLVTGADDEKFCALAGQMLGHMPHANQVAIPGTGHAPHLEDPAQTGAAISGWLQENQFI